MFDLWFEEVLFGGVFVLDYIEKCLMRGVLMFYSWLFIFGFCLEFFEYNLFRVVENNNDSYMMVLFSVSSLVGGWENLS